MTEMSEAKRTDNFLFTFPAIKFTIPFMPDGLSAQDHLRANLPQVEALKKRQLFDAMKQSAPDRQPSQSAQPAPRINIGSNGSLVGLQPVTQNPQSPNIDLPTPNMQGVVNTEPQPVRLGIDLAGLKGSDRGMAQLGAMQDADRQGLNTKTSGDFVETQAPRPKHLGIGAHIKAALKDAVINTGEYAKTHPGASTGELLGAGGAGAAVGGASPDTGDILNRRYQIQQQEGDVANQLGLEGRQAQVRNEQMRPAIDLAKIRDETRKTQETADREDARLRETARHNRATEAKPRAGQQAERNVVDGKIVEKQADGTWKPVYEGSGSKRGDETPQQYRTRLGQYRAANKELTDLTSQETEAAKRKDAAYARASSLKDWMNKKANDENGQPVYNEDVQRAEREAEAAEKYWRDFESKKSAAQAKLVQFGDVDERGNPSEPIQSKANGSTSSQKLTIEGAIEHFKTVKKRAPSQTEIAKMQAALPQ